MGLVLCMASVKGGSGKTVLSATFAALLTEIGRKVLLVDTDAATNGLSLLYLDEILAEQERRQASSDEVAVAGVFELAGLPSGANYSYIPLPSGARLLPATIGFFNTEEAPADLYRAVLRLNLAAWRERFDYVLLDAQAGSDVYATISMELADRVIIVSEYDPLSAAGVERMKALFPKLLAYERTWVVLNKMLPDLVSGYSDFMEVARYLRPIPWDADVVRAYSRRSLALDLNVGNAHTLAVIGTLRSLLPPNDVAAFDKWVTTKAEGIRRPVALQIRDLREQIKGAEELRRRELRAQTASTVAVSAAATIAIALLLSFAPDLAPSPAIAAGVTILLIAALAATVVTSQTIMARVMRSRVGLPKDGIDPVRFRRTHLQDRLAQLESLAVLDDQALIAAAHADPVRALVQRARAEGEGADEVDRGK